MSRRPLPPAWLRLLAMTAVLVSSTVATADMPAVPSFSQTGINDAAAGVPETGSSAATSSLASASVDPATGIATASVTLSYPKARGHAQPRVSLGYSSVAGQGFAGWGWTLSFPEIERYTLSGPPTYNDHFSGATPSDDRFSFNGQPLIPICQVSQCSGPPNIRGGGFVASSSVPPNSWYFRLENDTLHAQFFWFPTTLTWLVELPSGETLELGVPLDTMWSGMGDNTVDFDFSVAPQVPAYRWYVARQYDAQRDSSGAIANPIVYGWSKVDEYLRTELRSYLTDIWDTPAPGFSARQMPSFAQHLHFEYQHPTAATNPGVVDPPIWRVTPASTLTTVDVTSANFMAANPRYQVRRYHLGYEQYNNRQYLNSVTIEGRCEQPAAEDPTSWQLPAATNCPELPPTTFDYLLPETIPQTVSILGLIPDNAIILDVNGDGIPDFVGTTADPTLQPLALNGAGAAPNVVVQQNMSVTSPGEFSVTASAFNPWVSPSSFAAGVVLADGNINAIWTAGVVFQSGTDQQAFTPQPSSTSGAQWTWSPQGNSSTLAGMGHISANGDCSSNKTQLTFTAPEQPLAITDIDGDGFADEVTVIANIDAPNEPFIYCCNGADADGNCIGGTQCPQCSSDGTGAHATSAALNVRYGVLNPDGTTNTFGNAINNFATIPDLQSWPILPDGLTVTDFYEDMNGDGLSDLVVIRTNTYPNYVGYLPGQGTGP